MGKYASDYRLYSVLVTKSMFWVVAKLKVVQEVSTANNTKLHSSRIWWVDFSNSVLKSSPKTPGYYCSHQLW